MPEHLRGSPVLLARAFADLAERVPSWWVRDDAATVRQQSTRANGWTRRQLQGMRHPEWITYGWADPPPAALRSEA